MPFLGVAPWRRQYFAGQPCPDDVLVPVDDPPTWDLYPERRWIHNKLAICETQRLPHGPHGTTPPQFPIFSKPIYNLRGMGAGGRIIASAEEYDAALTAGHLWMPLLAGEHVSTDLALVDGRIAWCRHTTGVAASAGTFDHWIVQAEARPALEDYLAEWSGRNLQGFTGIVNIETIGGRIIECHLRLADQWVDLNGAGWLGAVVELYATGRWRLRERRRTGYSVVLFGAPGLVPRHIDEAAVATLLTTPGVSSIQVTFDKSRPAAAHAMPPGGFRLAIVNCWNLEVGNRVRSDLRRLFPADRSAGGASATA